LFVRNGIRTHALIEDQNSLEPTPYRRARIMP